MEDERRNTAFARALAASGAESFRSLLPRVTRPEAGAHAVLIHGAGPEPLAFAALALASAWMCPNSDEHGPCGVCGICTSVDAGRAVDLLDIRPGGAQNLIRLGAIQETESESTQEAVPLSRFVRTRPLMARRKVAVLHSADRLNQAAAHSLLKTLEEPQPHVRLVLTTADPGRILPTIRSRCIRCDAFFDQDDAGPAPETLAAWNEFLKEAEGLLPRGPEAVPALAAAGERLQKGLVGAGLESGAAHAEALRMVGEWLAAGTVNPEVRLACTEAHRAALGNALPDLVWLVFFGRVARAGVGT